MNLTDLAISVVAELYRVDTGHFLYFFQFEDLLSRHWILSLRFLFQLLSGDVEEKRSKYIEQLGLSEFGAIDQSHNY